MHVMAPGKVTLCFAVLVLALALHTTVVRAEAEAEVELTYVKEVTNVAKFQAFIAKHKYVAVEAYTGFEKAAKSLFPVPFVRVNAEDLPEITSKILGVKTFPSLVILKNGQVAHRYQGAHMASLIAEWVKERVTDYFFEWTSLEDALTWRSARDTSRPLVVSLYATNATEMFGESAKAGKRNLDLHYYGYVLAPDMAEWGVTKLPATIVIKADGTKVVFPNPRWVMFELSKWVHATDEFTDQSYDRQIVEMYTKFAVVLFDREKTTPEVFDAWTKTITEVAAKYPGLKFNYAYTDRVQLIGNQFHMSDRTLPSISVVQHGAASTAPFITTATEIDDFIFSWASGKFLDHTDQTDVKPFYPGSFVKLLATQHIPALLADRNSDIIVYFWSPGCTKCPISRALLNATASVFKDEPRISFYYFNVSNSLLPPAWKVDFTPTLFLIRKDSNILEPVTLTVDTDLSKMISSIRGAVSFALDAPPQNVLSTWNTHIKEIMPRIKLDAGLLEERGEDSETIFERYGIKFNDDGSIEVDPNVIPEEPLDNITTDYYKDGNDPAEDQTIIVEEHNHGDISMGTTADLPDQSDKEILAAVGGNEPVSSWTELTPATLNPFIGKYERVVIEYYNSEFEKARGYSAKTHAAIISNYVAFGRVDVDKHPELAEKAGFKLFPSYSYYRYRIRFPVDSVATTDDLAKHLEKRWKAEPTRVSTHRQVEQMTHNILEQYRTSFVVVASLEDNSPHLRALQLLAETFLESVVCLHGVGGTPGVFVRQFDHDIPQSGDAFWLIRTGITTSLRTKNLTYESLKNWIIENGPSNMESFTPPIYRELYAAPKRPFVFVPLDHSAPDHPETMAWIRDLVQIYKKDGYKFLIASADSHADDMFDFGVHKLRVPTASIVEWSENGILRFTRLPRHRAFTQESVSVWLHDHKIGKLQPNVRKGAVSQGLEGMEGLPHTFLSKWDEDVMNPEKDVFVLLYHPVWQRCFYCPMVDSYLQSFATNVSSVDTLAFYKFDVTVNDLPEQFAYLAKNLPAAFVFPKNDKTHPIEFSRLFNAPTLVEFFRSFDMLPESFDTTSILGK